MCYIYIIYLHITYRSLISHTRFPFAFPPALVSHTTLDQVTPEDVREEVMGLPGFHRFSGCSETCCG